VNVLGVRSLGGAATAVALALAAPPAQAQMFHLYLQCQGTIAAGLQSGAAAALAAEPAAAPRGVEAAPESASDKNDNDPNVQARTRAVRGAAKRGTAHLELALRDNNMTAFVQRSNVLPTGERMKYVATQTHYSAAYSPAHTGQAYVDWRGSWLFMRHRRSVDWIWPMKGCSGFSSCWLFTRRHTGVTTHLLDPWSWCQRSIWAR